MSSSSQGSGRMLSPSAPSTPSAPSAAPAAPVAGTSASGPHQHAVSSVGGSTSRNIPSGSFPKSNASSSLSLELVPSNHTRQLEAPSQSHSSRSQTRAPATAQPKPRPSSKTASTSEPASKSQLVKAQPSSMLRLQNDATPPTEASSSKSSDDDDEESSSEDELLLHEARAKSRRSPLPGPAATASRAGSAPLCLARNNIETKAKVKPPPRMLKARSNETKKVTIVSTVRGDDDSSMASSSPDESSSKSPTESSSGSASDSESESGSGSSSSASSPRARQPPKKKRLIARSQSSNSESSSSHSSTRVSMSPKTLIRVIAPPLATQKEQIQTKRPRALSPLSSVSPLEDSSEDSESLSNSAPSALSKAPPPIAKASSSSSESSSARASFSTSSSSFSTLDAPAALSPPPLKVTRKRPRIIDTSNEESDSTPSSSSSSSSSSNEDERPIKSIKAQKCSPTAVPYKRNKVETLLRNCGSEMMTEAPAARTTFTSARHSKNAVQTATAQRPQLVERTQHVKPGSEAEGKVAKPQKVSTPSATPGAGLSRDRSTSTGSSPIVQRAALDGPTTSASQANKRISQTASAASRLHAPPPAAQAPASILASAPNSRVVSARKPQAEHTFQSPETSAPKREAAPAAPAPAARTAAVPKPSTAARPPRSTIRSSTFELVVPVMQLPRKKRKTKYEPQVRVPRSPVTSPVAQPNLDGVAASSTRGAAMEQSRSTSSASSSGTPLSSTSMAPVSTLTDHRMGSTVVDTKPIVRKLNMALAPEPVPPLAPVAPLEPIISLASAGPVTLVPPVAPVAPVAPVSPLASIAPAATIAPIAPVVPLAPAALAISVEPVRSFAHVVVATPTAVTAPFASVAPVTQAAPVIDGRPTLRPLSGPPGIELRNVAPRAPPDTRFNPLLEYFIMPAHLLGYAVRPYDPNNKGKGKARTLSSVPPERLPTPSMFASVDFMSAESFGLRRTQRVVQKALRPCDVPAPFSVTPLAASTAASTSPSSDDDDDDNDDGDDGTDSDDQDDTNHHFDFVLNTRRGHPELDTQLLSFEIDYGSDNEEDYAELDRSSIVRRELEEGKGYTTPWRLDGIDEGRRGITRALEIDAGMNGRFFAVARPTPSPEMIRAWEADQTRSPAKVEKSKKRGSAVVETDSEFEIEDSEVAEDSGSDYAKGGVKSCRAVAAQAYARPQQFIPPRLHRKPTHFASVPDPFDLGTSSQPPAFSSILAPPAALKRASEVAAKVLPNEPTVPPLGPANRTLPQPSLNDAAHPATPPRSRSTSPVTHLGPQPFPDYQPNARSQTHTPQLVGSTPLHPALRATVAPHSPTTHVSQPSAYPNPLPRLSLSHFPTMASTRLSSAHAGAYKPVKDLVRIPMVMQRNASPFLYVSELSAPIPRPTSSSSASATGSSSSTDAVGPRSKVKGVPGIRPLSFPRPPIVGAHMSGSQRPVQAESTVQGGRLSGSLNGGATPR